jgi:hypothetical protein
VAEAFRDYIGDIYVQDSSESGTTGSICWAPIYYTTPNVNVVRPLVNDPASPGFGQYTVKHVHLAAIADQRNVPFEHRFPDGNLKLTLGEAATSAAPPMHCASPIRPSRATVRSLVNSRRKPSAGR